MASTTDTSPDSSSAPTSLTRTTGVTPPSPTPGFDYVEINELFKRIDAAEGDVLRVSNVAVDDFRRILSESDSRGRKFKFSLYSASTKTLIVTIPTAPHEQLHLILNEECLAAAIAMNIHREFVPVGSTTYEILDDAGNLKASGEGGSARKPLSKRPSGGDFPTLVIEAGYTQTWPSLRTKARWWFEQSKYDVKIVLLARAELSHARIIIEKWKAVEKSSMRTGAMTTRALTTLATACVQTVVITRSAGIGPNDPRRFAAMSYGVTRGPLRLEFEDLFLRRPMPGEGDIIIGTEQLQYYAVNVWRAFS